MKKISVLIIMTVLLFPASLFAKKLKPFSFLQSKRKNYTSFCSTLPASSPVFVTLSEIGYEDGKTTLGDSLNKNEIKTKPSQIYTRHSIRNNSKKTITACYFQVQIYFTTFAIFDNLLYEGNVIWEGIKIRPGKSFAQTRHETFNSSIKSHDYIKSGMDEYITKIVYKVYLVKYSDGTSESLTP